MTSVDNNGVTGTPGVPHVVLNSQYDPIGNRTALSAAITPIGGTASTNDFLNSCTYDRLNRLKQIVQQSNGGYAVAYKKTALGYDAASRLTSLADFKDSTTQAVSGSYGYDAVNRLTSLTWYGPGGPFNSSGGYSGGSNGGYFESMSWGFDVDNRVASMTNLDYPNENLSYTYDHDSQLINAAASYGGYGGYGGLGGGSYSWDDNGNSTKTGWITGAGNRLLSDGTYNYSYDYSGNVVKRSAITGGAETDYFWDTRGRLVTVTDKNSSGTTLQVVANSYDMFNDLIGRTWTQYANGVAGTPQITRFVYDLGGTGKQSLPVSGSGNAVLAFNGNGSMTDRYLWGPAVDQILADERFAPTGSNQMPSTAGTTYWALTDNENSVRDWITYGSLVDHIVYDSFGKVFSHSNSSITFAFGHNGVFYDPATGLEYHSEPSTGTPGRWYNPSIQRWMSEDPTGLGPDSDPYRYILNSPTNGTDPSGLACPGNPFLGPQLAAYKKKYGHAPPPITLADAGEGFVEGIAIGAFAIGAIEAAPVVVTWVSTTATAAGTEIYVIGSLTAAQLQNLIASSGDRVVTVFTKLSSSPAADRILSAAYNPQLCEQIKNGTMYVGRIPADLFARLHAEGLITDAITQMGEVTDREIIFSSDAMKILSHYFTNAPK